MSDAERPDQASGPAQGVSTVLLWLLITAMLLVLLLTGGALVWMIISLY
ncbi:MAG: hypothetical protein H0V13_01935 [Nocardioidaceae bacterium]|nr:hypothetical protein [Nocardioidaceae bacterium]